MRSEADEVAGAMNEAYTYEDRDNGSPTLPFIDDGDNFWEPFGAKVAAILAANSDLIVMTRAELRERLEAIYEVAGHNDDWGIRVIYLDAILAALFPDPEAPR